MLTAGQRGEMRMLSLVADRKRSLSVREEAAQKRRG